MADNADMESSVDSLDDGQYVLIDDASETSTADGRETASLASTEHALSDDEGETTPEEADDEDIINFNAGSVGDLAATLGLRNEQRAAEENELMDSYELETPRQSTIHPFALMTDGLSAPTAASDGTGISSGNGPVSLRVLLYCPKPNFPSDIAYKLGARITSCLGGGDGGAYRITKLPETPDHKQGKLLCQDANLEITIEQTDCVARPSGRNVLTRQAASDLIVVHLPNLVQLPIGFCRDLRHRTRPDMPIMIITKTREDKKAIEGLCDCEMLVDEHDFFGRNEEIMKMELQSVLRRALSSQGWNTRHVRPKEVAKAVALGIPARIKGGHTLMRMAIGALLIALLAPLLLTVYEPPSQRNIVGIQGRRELLFTSLKEWTNYTTSEINELVPQILPHHPDARLRAEFVVLQPNQVAVTVVDRFGRPASGLVRAEVTRAHDTHVNFNLTTLLDGVFGVALPVEEAYGSIQVNITLSKPHTNVLFTSDFGNRVWRRSTYEKARTDLAKAVNKDVSVARTAAKSLTDRVGVELAAGAAATKNVTTQLAIRVSRDVQIFASTAVGVLGKAASMSAGTAEQISKDLSIVQHDLTQRVDEVKKSFLITANSIKDLIVPAKKIITAPLDVSRQRARGFKEALAVKKQWPHA